MRSRSSKNKQNGMALVIVLWMLALLTLLAAGYSRMMRTETMLISQHVQLAEARAMAEAGVWLAIQDLLAMEVDRKWLSDGREYTFSWYEGGISLQLQDEAGRIDLNTARAELLHGLLQDSGIDEAEAIGLLQAIMDWRDRDNLPRTAGAEDKDYRLAGRNYGAKDGPFNSVEELRQVLGMNDSIFAAVEPALTVYSHQPGINPVVAPREALLAIPGIDDTAIEAYLAAKASSGTAEELFTGSTDNRFLSPIRDQVIRVHSTGTRGENQVLLEATVLLSRNQDDPFSILAWRER